MEKMKHLLIAFILLCFGCKKEQQIIPDPIAEYVAEFDQCAKKYNKKTKLNKISFVLQGNINSKQGWSNYYYDGVVYLDTTSFSYRFRLRALVFHELGHGALGRDHNDKVFPNGKSGSIMNILPSNFRPGAELYDYYVEELFIF